MPFENLPEQASIFGSVMLALFNKLPCIIIFQQERQLGEPLLVFGKIVPGSRVHQSQAGLDTPQQIIGLAQHTALIFCQFSLLPE